MSYFDYKGFIHDKPCVDGKPKSNNSKLYTFYLKKLDPSFEITFEMFTEVNESYRKRVRLTYKDAPVISRDEMLGICGLYPYLAGIFIHYFWMAKTKPKFNPFKFCAQLVLLIQNRKDRNYWWQNNLEQMQFLTMRTPIQDRAFFYRLAKIETPMIYRFIEWIDKKLKPKSNSGKLLRWLKYDQMPELKVFEEYFGKDHPITKQAMRMGI